MFPNVTQARRNGPGGVVLGAVAIFVALAAAAPAAAKEPPITVRTALLSAAFHCHGTLRNAAKEPILLVTGTGATGEQTYAFGKGAFDALGHPVCDVNFPDYETADIQVSVRYLVYAIRREFKQSGREIAVFGISQGSLLPRFALTYWPDLRRKVTDVLAAAGTEHGTTVPPFANGQRCSASRPCPPAVWQQQKGSHLLTALSAQPLEAPGPTSWTTVRSSTDELVQPQTGKHPTSALAGASNILIQDVCPGRKVSHIGTAVDSVTFAAFIDAITHHGPARLSRLPKNVCSHPYAPGLNVATTIALLSGVSGLTSTQIAREPTVTAEPKVWSYFLR
jgi:triacylglycerol lipase